MRGSSEGATTGAGRNWRQVAKAVTLLLVLLAGSAVASLADSLAVLSTAPADSVPSAVPLRADTEPPPPVPDFFDTGVSGTSAVLMSPVFPGWGQLYAENSWRAMLAFGSQWYFWSNMLARDRQAVRYRDYARTIEPGTARDFYDDIADEYWEQMRDYAWWSGAIVLIIALDAYVGTGLYGFDEEPLPVPSRFEEFFDKTSPEPIGSRGAPTLVIWQWSRRF